MPRQLPSLPVQNRWFAEPLRLLFLPGSIFIKNQSGYPVFSKAIQALLFKYMRVNPPWILLSDVGHLPSGNDSNTIISEGGGLLSPTVTADAANSDGSRSPTPAEAAARQVQSPTKKKSKDPTPHLSYVRYLQRKQPPKTAIERFGAGYQDYLQAPLQPLADDLESVTYEVFEKDPVKYDCYERAIAAALRDWIASGKSRSGSESRIVVAVVGAGRGPLVSRALHAAASVGATIELWAVEKNPNAYVLLQRHNQDHWGGQVTVVKSDMRSWKGPQRWRSGKVILDQVSSSGSKEHYDEPSGDYNPSSGKVDIFISELLGSFGDNELSPECLDGVEHLLNPVDGISIPSSYSSHLTPITTPRLHANIRPRSDKDQTISETPYVVMLHAFANLAMSLADSGYEPMILKAWEFLHPSPASRGQMSKDHASSVDDGNVHNRRFSQLRFSCPWRGACDGLAGYFEATLYGDVELSIRPDTIDKKSPDMTSWFPLFFPLKVSTLPIEASIN